MCGNGTGFLAEGKDNSDIEAVVGARPFPDVGRHPQMTQMNTDSLKEEFH
jgi:hypothetical protein